MPVGHVLNLEDGLWTFRNLMTSCRCSVPLERHLPVTQDRAALCLDDALVKRFGFFLAL